MMPKESRNPISSITRCDRGCSQRDRPIQGIDYDREVVAVGTILHDIGLTASVSGPNRFEVNGAEAARSFIKARASRTAAHN